MPRVLRKQGTEVAFETKRLLKRQEEEDYGVMIGVDGTFEGHSSTLEFYEKQYREKLKALEEERLKSQTLTEQVQACEQALRDALEDNARLTSELQECMADNGLLT